MFTRLNEYAAAINTTTSVLAIILVLGLYNREQTASMTTPVSYTHLDVYKRQG